MSNMSDKSLRITIVVLSLLLCWVTVMYSNQHEELKKSNPKIEVFEGGDISKAQTIDSLQKVIDSLHAEVFPCQVELGRYQVAYEIFMERNPKAASQYGDIISNETE
jgi:hypothetical protein